MYILRADSSICNTWGRTLRSSVFGIETSFCHVWTFVRGMCVCAFCVRMCLYAGRYVWRLCALNNVLATVARIASDLQISHKRLLL